MALVGDLAALRDTLRACFTRVADKFHKRNNMTTAAGRAVAAIAARREQLARAADVQPPGGDRGHCGPAAVDMLLRL